MGLAQYLQRKILDHVLGKTTFTAPATVYIALYTVAPTNAGGGTEVTGGSYARVAVTNNTTNFPNASGGDPASKANGAAVTFPTPTADWGLVVAWAMMDASSGGNQLYNAALETPRNILNGSAAPSFAIGELAFTETGV